MFSSVYCYGAEQQPTLPTGGKGTSPSRKSVGFVQNTFSGLRLWKDEFLLLGCLEGQDSWLGFAAFVDVLCLEALGAKLLDSCVLS